MASRWKSQNSGLGAPSIIESPLAGFASATEVTFALNSAYAYNSSGAAFFYAFLCPESATLTDVWLKVKSYGGTWGSTDGKINLEIRESIVANFRPGSTLAGSATLTLDGSTTGWIHFSGLAISLTAGKFYSFVIGDADGGATNFVTMACSYQSGTAAASSFGTYCPTTSNGFIAGAAGSGGTPAAVIKVGSTFLAGQCFDSIATITSGTYERGQRFAPDENCTLIGVFDQTDSSNLVNGGTWKLYADATAPGGTTLTSFTTVNAAVGGTAPFVASLIFPQSSWYDLKAGIYYRFVFLPPASLTTPRKVTINGNPDSTLLQACLPFSGNSNWTQQNGSAWDDTATNSACHAAPILVPTTFSGGSRAYAA